MDLEAGKDDLSVEDGKLVVFVQIKFTIKEPIGQSCLKSNSRDGRVGQKILTNACGALRPGRLTFIIGPSGAGKTTLLKILARRKKTGVTGSVLGGGRNIVLVSQHTTLIDALTAKETLHFAAHLKLPYATSRERLCLKHKFTYISVSIEAEPHLWSHINSLITKIESVSKQLGIHEVLHRRAGKLSGGERKRLTIACELLTDPTILLLDEPTSGLDSASSMAMSRALRAIAVGGRTVACVVHQPSSKLFASADDVILLANGRTLYAGAVADLPATLSRAGFICPPYYNMADYLLEVATNEHPGNLDLLESEAISFAVAMKDIGTNDTVVKNGKDMSNEADALLSKRVAQPVGYKAGMFTQLGVLLWRGVICTIRDIHLTQIRLLAHLLVALLLGALYNGAGVEAGRIQSNTGCIFFFLLFLFFSNAMPTIHTFPVEAKVVLQEHLNGWYSLPMYCASKIIVDLPIQLLCATIFVVPAWFLTSQPLELFRMGMAWAICVLVTILAQTFGLAVGAACGVKLGLFVIPAANIPMLMFSEFFIPYHEMPIYLRPFSLISYFRYAFNGLLQTVYGFHRPKLACNEAFCMFKAPQSYLNYLGMNHSYILDVYVLLAWIGLLQITLVAVLYFRVYKACR